MDESRTLTAEDIAKMADSGGSVMRFFSNDGKRLQPLNPPSKQQHQENPDGSIKK